LILGYYSEEFIFTQDFTLKDHEPINIYAGSTLEIGSDGITRGAGTQNDPYYIEFWIIENIGGPYDTANGINIQDRGEYFVIVNCSISGFKNEEWATGISITGLGYVKVLENNITDCSKGIFFNSVWQGDGDNSILNNDLTDLRNVGIELSGDYSGSCGQTTVSYNNIDSVSSMSGGDWDGVGILLHGTSECKITNNTVKSCENYGIVVGVGSYNTNTIAYNNLCGNNNGGIHIDAEEDDNTMHDNSCGLEEMNFDISGFSPGIIMVIGIIKYTRIESPTTYFFFLLEKLIIIPHTDPKWCPESLPGEKKFMEMIIPPLKRTLNRLM